jgi:3-(3-hydroxy-phenyl)propionate hydroxylase
MNRTAVVVVGAGPTGVTAASLLGAAGVPCLLLDRWTDVFPQPRAVHLDDEVFRILGRLGVADAFARISRPGLGLRLLDREHRVLAEFRRAPGSGRHGFPAANMFDQPELERLLRDNLGRFPSVSFRGYVEVVAVTQTSEQVQVELEDRSTGQRETVSASYLLGCDGANSLVRRSIGSAMTDLGFEQRWLVVDVDTDADLEAWGGVHQVCDTARAATYMRVTGRRHRWEFRLAPEEDALQVASPASLEGLLRPWTRELPFSDLSVVRTAEYTFRAQVADRWRDGRVFLLGDAAHLTPPFIGQGMGAGLRDADNLAWKLSGVLAHRLPESVLDSYEAERRPHAVVLIRTARLVGQVMTGGGELGDGLRRVVAPALTRVPGLGRRLLDSRSPRLRRSGLVRRTVGTGPLPGSLCPNELLVDGRRYDDLNPGGFVLVTTQVLGASVERLLERRGVLVHRVAQTSAHGLWLRQARSRHALVRPDGTVMVAGRRPDRLASVLRDRLLEPPSTLTARHPTTA